MPLLRIIDESHFTADLFAGDSFSDIYGVHRLFFRAVTRWCVLLWGKPYVLLPQTYGPFESRAGQAIAVSILRKASLLFSRTMNDCALDQLPYATAYRAIYCPDVAFALDRTPAGLTWQTVGVKIDGRSDITIVGLNVSGLLYNGGYSRDNMFRLKMDYQGFVHDLIAYLLSVPDVHVVLIPHTYTLTNLGDVENDLGACFRAASVFPAYEERLSLLNRSLDQHEVKTLIGDCDLFVGSRLHSCIAALSVGVVAVGVAYSKKFHETFATLGVADLVIDARTCDGANAITKISEIMKNRTAYQARIAVGVRHNLSVIQTSFGLIQQKMSAMLLPTPN